VNRLTSLLVISLILGFSSCTEAPKTKEKKGVVMTAAPNFNADSAYAFVQSQVDFGPRVPDTDEHRACGDWLESKFTQFGATVVVQTGTVERYDGLKLPLRNIIACYNPDRAARVLLCAHWDTRPFADQGNTDIEKPIDGANDGGSGVAVLLEIARQLSIEKPNIGVDIVLFDVEDQGQPDFDTNPQKRDTYCLGSQYWGNNLHDESYNAMYGILLDMVGAKGATFSMEQVSLQYAGGQTKKVWDTGNQLGYGRHFMYKKTHPITDDHVYVNLLTGIPTLDIIEYYGATPSNFGPYWHTHDDNMDVIDRKTLKAVGQTLLQVIFNEK
jgi:glutaminyl-peptide cyclotransferase